MQSFKDALQLMMCGLLFVYNKKIDGPESKASYLLPICLKPDCL
jgi:hypothetical protein